MVYNCETSHIPVPFSLWFCAAPGLTRKALGRTRSSMSKDPDSSPPISPGVRRKVGWSFHRQHIALVMASIMREDYTLWNGSPYFMQ